MSEQTARFLVTPQWRNERIDRFLAANTDISRRGVRRLIAEGLVQCNGKVLRVQSRIVAVGDVIDIDQPSADIGAPDRPSRSSSSDHLPAAAGEVVILHQDRWLLVASKPAGVLSQPAEHGLPGELAFDQQVLLHLAVGEGRRPFLRLVHRLDRMTSGAVLFARHPDALPALTRAWSEEQVERHYLAVIEGLPEFDATEIDLSIARDRSHTWRFRTSQAGKAARTRVEVLARLEHDLSLVRCQLITGRTHQVRVHLADAGHPVLGDRLYGSRRATSARRPLLHAASISLPHPAAGERLRVDCPLPDDMEAYVPEGLDLRY
ncbi:MAG: RluA family pseudouridine synthase [Thermoanaerobaculales bacterium]